jgi:uncharacterized integral membrane protein (TIGR00697 family)
MIRLPKSLEFLVMLAMMYVAIDLSSMVFAYKIIKFNGVLYAASSLIFPLTYSLMDIVAEIYGYQAAKKIILFGFACDIVFVASVFLLSHIPSPDQAETAAYLHVLGGLIGVVFAQMIGVLLGAFLNIHVIVKLKLLTNGRYFWIRSIMASLTGEGIMLVISASVALIGVLSVSELVVLVACTFVYKIVFAILAAPVVSIIVRLLKIKVIGREELIDFNLLCKSNNQELSSSFQSL